MEKDRVRAFAGEELRRSMARGLGAGLVLSRITGFKMHERFAYSHLLRCILHRDLMTRRIWNIRNGSISHCVRLKQHTCLTAVYMLQDLAETKSMCHTLTISPVVVTLDFKACEALGSRLLQRRAAGARMPKTRLLSPAKMWSSSNTTTQIWSTRLVFEPPPNITRSIFQLA